MAGASPEEQKKFWEGIWASEKDMMESFEVNRLLKANIDRLENGRKSLKVFLPLCGDTLDIKWLADRGHTVIGVEFVEEAVKNFLKKQGIEYTVEPAPACKGSLYKSKDGRMRLYCCDILEWSCEIEGKADVVYDSHAITVVPGEKKQRCADILISMMAPGCFYLLETYESKEGHGHHHHEDHHHGDHHHGDHHHDHGDHHHGDHHHGDDQHGSCHGNEQHSDCHGHDHHGGEHGEGEGSGCSFKEEDVIKMYGEKCHVEKVTDVDAKEAFKHLEGDAQHAVCLDMMHHSRQKVYILTLQ